MAHLGERVVALVDGQLTADAVERVHVHLAGCRRCREAVEAERLMKARLASLRGPEPGVDLRERLLAMGGPNGPLPPRAGYVPGTPRPQPVTLPRSATVAVVDPFGGMAVAAAPAVADRPAGRRPRQTAAALVGSGRPGRASSRPRSRLTVAAVFGALSVVGVGITGLTASGTIRAPSAPTVVPPVDSLVMQPSPSPGNLQFTDSAASSASWELTMAGRGSGFGR